MFIVFIVFIVHHVKNLCMTIKGSVYDGYTGLAGLELLGQIVSLNTHTKPQTMKHLRESNTIKVGSSCNKRKRNCYLCSFLFHLFFIYKFFYIPNRPSCWNACIFYASSTAIIPSLLMHVFFPYFHPLKNKTRKNQQKHD